MDDEPKTERVQLMMSLSEVKAVDDWSFEKKVRGRSEAIRRLIELGLKAASEGSALSLKPIKRPA